MSRLQANLLLLISAIIWGSTFVVQQVSMDLIGPMTFTAARFFLGLITVAPLAIREWNRKKSLSRHLNQRPLSNKDLMLMVLIGVILFVGTIVQQIGIIHTSVTNAGFLTAMYVPLVPLLGLIIFRKNPHWVIWIAVAFSLTGTTLISGVDSSLELGYGDALVLTSSIFWGLHVLLVGVIASKTSMPLTVAAIQFAVVTLISTLWAVSVETVSIDALLSAAWFIAYAGFFSVGIAFTLQVVGQSHTLPTDAALILSLETVFAAIAGATFLQERIGNIEIIGCAMLLSAILMVEVLPKILRKRRRVT
ncbi:MAG: DMT family transporter [Halopseudomonas aestusnigri]